jgi:hypothetical protein
LRKEAEKARMGITGLGAVAGSVKNPLEPDVDLLPVGERLTWLWVLLDAAKQVPEHFPLDVLKREPNDSVFSAIASVPGEYIGLGRKGCRLTFKNSFAA